MGLDKEEVNNIGLMVQSMRAIGVMIWPMAKVD